MIYNIAENKNLIEGIGIVKKSFTFSSNYINDSSSFYSFCETCDYTKFIGGKFFLDYTGSFRAEYFSILAFIKANAVYIIAFEGLLLNTIIRGTIISEENEDILSSNKSDPNNPTVFYLNNCTLDLYFEV